MSLAGSLCVAWAIQMPLGREMGPVVRRGAGDDAVVVERILLRLLEPLLSARGAAVPVGQARARGRRTLR